MFWNIHIKISWHYFRFIEWFELRTNHIDSLTVFAHSAGAFNWTYFMPVFIHTQFEDFYFVQAPGVLLFSGEMYKKSQQFFNFRNCRFKCWRRQFCNCAHWLQSACNIKIHKTQTVSEKEWGQLKLRHIKCALLSSTNIYVFLFKLIAIMSDYTTRLGY